MSDNGSVSGKTPNCRTSEGACAGCPNPLVSVVVPVYKTERYLDQCVKSILGQTYGNIELILVDDGSPDRCPGMCDAWARKDERVRAVHKANGGLSSARNAGMSRASGEYVSFVDSDDWLEPDFFEQGVLQIEQYHKDGDSPEILIWGGITGRKKTGAESCGLRKGSGFTRMRAARIR